MKSLNTDVLLIKPKENVFLKNIKIEQKNQSEVKTTWLVSSVCNSERRRFNLTKSHNQLNTFVGGHEAVGFLEDEFYVKRNYALLPHSNCLTRNDALKCPACFNNKENLCTRMQHAGLDENTPSGFANQMYVPKSQLFDVTDIDLEISPFIEPLSCVIHSWEKVSTQVKSNISTVNIVGGGPIGCLHAFYLIKIYKNNIKINLIEKNYKRYEVLRKIFSNYKNITIANNDEIKLSDISVMSASNNSAYKKTVNLTKKEGTVILFSGFDDLNFMDNNFLPEIIHRNEFVHYSSNLVFVGSSGYTMNDLKTAKKLLLNFDVLKNIITGKVHGLGSKIIHMHDGTTKVYKDPILIKDIKGHFPEHIKIQYYNNYEEYKRRS